MSRLVSMTEMLKKAEVITLLVNSTSTTKMDPSGITSCCENNSPIILGFLKVLVGTWVACCCCRHGKWFVGQWM